MWTNQDLNNALTSLTRYFWDKTLEHMEVNFPSPKMDRFDDDMPFAHTVLFECVPSMSNFTLLLLNAIAKLTNYIFYKNTENFLNNSYISLHFSQ